MAHSPDDSPSDRVSPVSPPILPVTSGESEPATSAHPQQTDGEGKESADPQAVMAVGGDPPRRPRRRRRRRPSREAGVAPQPGELSASPQGEGDPSWRRRRRRRGAGPDTGTGEASPREEIQAVEGPPAHKPASPPHEATAVREGGPGVSASRDGKVRTYLGRRRRPRIPPASASSGGQPMTNLHSNGVRSQPAGSHRKRGPLSSRKLASPAPGGGAVAHLVPQRERRSADTSLPADLPTRTVPGARRATVSADTESFPVGVRATPASGTRGECLGKRNTINVR